MTVLGLLLSGTAIASGWGQLKPGMSREETAAVLGAALISSSGRGFEVAIYDHRAELVYHEGKLVTWTAPASESAAVPPANTWQFNQVRTVPVSSANTLSPARAPAKRGAILPAYRL